MGMSALWYGGCEEMAEYSMTALQQAIAAVLAAFAGLKAGDRITPEGHEAVFVYFRAMFLEQDEVHVTVASKLRALDVRDAYHDRPSYHTISPKLFEAIKELENHST